MAQGAPKGNEYYLLRTKNGRDKKYPTPEKLADKAEEYFNFCQDNPLQKYVPNVKTGKLIAVPVPRAFTIHGLCNFLDMGVQAFHNYEKRKDFVEVCTRIRQVIYNQKFENAAAGLLNHSIIARDLGLVDKKEIEQVNMTPEERAQRIAELKKKMK